MTDLRAQIAALPETEATKSRDYGRGYAQAIKDVLAVLDSDDVTPAERALFPHRQRKSDCPSVSPHDSQTCQQHVGHSGPHRAALGTLVWWDERFRCQSAYSTGTSKHVCVHKAGHVREHASPGGMTWTDQ